MSSHVMPGCEVMSTIVTDLTTLDNKVIVIDEQPETRAGTWYHDAYTAAFRPPCTGLGVRG